MYLVKCDGCGSHGFTEDASDPDAAVDCNCCKKKHHHGKAANETGEACRPVTIVAIPGPTAGAANLLASGGN